MITQQTTMIYVLRNIYTVLWTICCVLWVIAVMVGFLNGYRVGLGVAAGGFGGLVIRIILVRWVWR